MRRGKWLYILIFFVLGTSLLASAYKGLTFEEWLQVLNHGNTAEKRVALEAMGYLYEPQVEDLLLTYLKTLTAQKLVHADMLANISYVPAGVVELMRKQQQGWAYIRP